MSASRHPSAVIGRQRKALAMAVVIDGDAIKQKLSPFDQAARIVLVSHEWTDATWEQIGVRAGYKRKPISEETREMVRDIYRGRAKAPVSRQVAS